jgi:hypothetical protein
MISFFYALVAVAVIGSNPPMAGIVDLFPDNAQCLVAKAEYDKLENNKEVKYIGSNCIKVEKAVDNT